jgi:hypothetical protein
VEVKLNDVAYAFPAGHRIRMSLSTSYWPLAWPPPEPVRLSVLTGQSRLRLPVRASVHESDAAIQFAPAEGVAAIPVRQLSEPRHKWRVIRDLAEDISTLEVINDNGSVYREEIDLEMQRKALEWYRYQGDDFSSMQGETLWERGFRRGDWRVRTVTRTLLSSTSSEFVVHAELDAYEEDKRIFAENWGVKVPRDLV